MITTSTIRGFKQDVNAFLKLRYATLHYFNTNTIKVVVNIVVL